MKKYILLIPTLLLLSGCIGLFPRAPKAPKNSIEQWAENLMTQYPNFKSNDITKSIVNDSIDQYVNTFVGKEAKLFEGVPFNFVRVEGTSNDSTTIQLKGSVLAEIESNADGGKYVMTGLCFLVLGNVPTDIAATLNTSDKYTVSGTVREIDTKDTLFKAMATYTHNDTFMGAFFIDNLKIDVIKDK
jgi:hypothetical protein